MPHEDDDVGKVDHADKVFQRAFPPHSEAMEVLEPGEETFYLPASAVSTQGPSILSMVLSVATVRSDHFHSALGQFPI